jgi:hypothetical protein
MARSSDGAVLLRSRGRGTGHSQGVVGARAASQRMPPIVSPSTALFIVADRPARAYRGDGIYRVPPLSAQRPRKLAPLACRPKWSGIPFRRMSPYWPEAGVATLRNLPGRRGRCHPRPPQIRTRRFPPSGSSRERFVPAGVSVDDPGRWQRMAGEERVEVSP